MNMQRMGSLDEFYNSVSFLGTVFYLIFIFKKETNKKNKPNICVLKCFIWMHIRVCGIESKLKKKKQHNLVQALTKAGAER